MDVDDSTLTSETLVGGRGTPLRDCQSSSPWIPCAIADWLSAIPHEQSTAEFASEHTQSLPRAAMAKPGPRSTTTSLLSSNTDMSTNKSSVEASDYRRRNLLLNRIFFENPGDILPPTISQFVDRVVYCGQNLQPPALDDEHFQNLQALCDGASELEVEEFYHKHISKCGDFAHLRAACRQSMPRQLVPYSGDGIRVTTPAPDHLIGYHPLAMHNARNQIAIMGRESEGTNQTTPLLYPFLSTEFKGHNGSMWVALNQAMGAASTAVAMMQKLNQRLLALKEQPAPESSAFAVIMNGSEARLYVAWPTSEGISVGTVRSFLLQNLGDYTSLLHCLRNILVWGHGSRLSSISSALQRLESARRPPLPPWPPAKKRKLQEPYIEAKPPPPNGSFDDSASTTTV